MIRSAFIVALMLFAAPAWAAGLQPYTLTAADAAAINAYLLPDYLPRHVSAGDVFGIYPGCKCVDVPVVAPIPQSDPPSVTVIEVLVPIAK